VTDGHVYVGLDLGTSGLKAIAITETGEVVGSGHAGYATRRPSPEAAEQDPRDWISAVDTAVGQLLSAVSAERWRGLGLAGMIPTLVTTDRAGQPTGPVITWEDARADHYGERLRALSGPERLYQLTGQWVDGRYLLPMYLRTATSEDAGTGDAVLMLGAKDYLFGWLTGEPATDPSTATGFGCFGLETGQWLPEIVDIAQQLSRSPLPLPGLPPVLASTTLRPLAPGASGQLGLPAGLPVCLGAADSVLGALGLGVRKVGDVAYVAGSSTVILGVSDRLVLDPQHRYLVTPLAGIEGWGLEMDLLSTGSAIAWLGSLLVASRGAGAAAAAYAAAAVASAAAAAASASIMELAASVEPGDGPVLLPYLAPGEQGALWDSSLRGAILGVHLGHGARHLARSLVDGILLESRRCLAVFDETGLPSGEIRVTGGSGTDRAFRAQLADATGRVVVTDGGRETRHSALGAAALAAFAIDGVSLPSRNHAGMVFDRPDARRAALYTALSLRHEQALAAVQAFSHAGAAGGGEGAGAAGGGFSAKGGQDRR